MAGAFATPARAQNAAAPPSPLSKSCEGGAAAIGAESPLPNLAADLAQRKTLRILAMGAAPGRVATRRGGYTDLIENILESALKGVDVVMINRGVSGELAAGAVVRMKNEVALETPDLVLWQVGTNDALAYVDPQDFAEIVTRQIVWLKAHKIDVVLVGLQFAPQMLRDDHYKKIRDTLREVAASENVMVIRFFEAMQIIEQAQSGAPLPVTDEFERSEAGYNCLAQYVARAITLGIFAKPMLKRPQP
ncbi:MAG: SGNH/GDSL hydrolase family protein [Proteobacteria bacterium]|nr:SGNH/GDSL hydrolase family protein [Pseudomonadota bacterium]